MNNKEFSELNEEQKKQFKKLWRSHSLKMAKISATFGLTLFSANFLVLIADKIYVRNPVFSTVGIVLNFLFSFRFYRFSLMKEHDRIKLEVKKIYKTD